MLFFIDFLEATKVYQHVKNVNITINLWIGKCESWRLEKKFIGRIFEWFFFLPPPTNNLFRQSSMTSFIHKPNFSNFVKENFLPLAKFVFLFSMLEKLNYHRSNRYSVALFSADFRQVYFHISYFCGYGVRTRNPTRGKRNFYHQKDLPLNGVFIILFRRFFRTFSSFFGVIAKHW